jgi:hypothetical protein
MLGFGKKASFCDKNLFYRDIDKNIVNHYVLGGQEKAYE